MNKKVKTYIVQLVATDEHTEVADIEIEAETKEEALEIYEDDQQSYIDNANWNDNGTSGDFEIEVNEVWEE